jgi:lipid II:glycine glycyltransferase (peptidoglycan interpeptide bridge formation enzyme)
MNVRLLTTAEDLGTYESWVAGHPHGSLWQSLAWKHLQEALGRTVRVYAAMNGERIEASALVVIDRTSFGLSTWDIPRGPLGRQEDLMKKILDDARAEKALCIYSSSLNPLFPNPNPSRRHIYPEASRVIDLTKTEEEILEQMKPKGRYNIRLAEKHGVIVRRSDDVDAYAAISHETGKRDGFIPQRADTYRKFLENVPGSFLFLAYEGGNTPAAPIAGLLGLLWGTTAIYYYGASGSQKRELMAPYLLQWEAMKLCKAQGAKTYDLFGIAPENEPNHPWAGVSDFKAKFGGAVETYPPEQVIVLRPFMKGLLDLKRKIF